MPISDYRRIRNVCVCAALAFSASAGSAVRAEDGRPGATAPLDLSTSVSPPAAIDRTPTGALKPEGLAIRPEGRISRLDLSLPRDLLPDLPPEAAAPALATLPLSLVDPLAAPKSGSASPAVNPAAAILETPPPATSTPVASAPIPALAQPQATPPAVAQPTPRSNSEILAAEVRQAVDRLVAESSAGRPIGAGDWSAACKAVASVYAERGYAPLWVEGDHFGSRGKAAIGRLARAGEDGLNLAHTPAPAAAWTDATPEGQAAADVALSAAVVAYALQATGARVNPRSLSTDIGEKPEIADPASALRQVAFSEDPDATLEAFNPQQAGYRALRDALASLSASETDAVARFGAGPVLKLGMTDPRVPLIRARFGLGALPDSAGSETYDIRVASAVRAFQRVHGLKPNGALTQATAAALDGANMQSRRKLLLLANMEMWRWEPHDMGALRVEVNVADFSLKLMDGPSLVHTARVIVGKPDTPTPIFSNSIKYMQFNPIWRVPDSIIKKEMEPHLARDPSYFSRHGYKVSYAGKKLIVEQPPGEANALGRMLFLFPNEYAVYLHDTPVHSLFSASYRALSHGCVRVQDPARLAEILMGGSARGWTGAKVHSLLGIKERILALPAPVPVHLEYFTAFVDETGTLQERKDIYGLTAKVEAKLASL